MARHGIPTARYRVVRRRAGGARASSRRASSAFRSSSRPTVSPPARASSSRPIAAAAHAAIRAAMEERQFGDAGSRRRARGVPRRARGVVLRALRRHAARSRSSSAQDHKRIFDDDDGPNTGGMGAFAPSPLVDAAMQARIMREIVDPVVARAARRRARVPRLSLRRPDADLRRSEGDRVQRALRRSRSAGRDAADRRRARAAPGGRRRRGARRARRSRSGPSRTSASSSRRAAIPASGPTGLPIAGLDVGRRSSRTCSSFTRARRGAADDDRHRRRPRADGRRPRRHATRTRSTRAYEGVSTISFDGMQYRRDIGRKAHA